MKYLLGTDTGSTMCKAALFDQEGRQIAVAGRPVGVMSPHPGWREVDPEVVWHNTAAAIAEVIALSNAKPADIVAVGTSGAGNGGYFLDAHCKPVCHAIQSSDSRAAESPDVEQEGYSTTLHAIHEWPAFAGETPIIGRWIKENNPEAYRRIRHVAVTKDYVKYCLTGALNSDVTDVAVAGFAGLGQDRYYREVVDLCGVPELWHALPEFGEPWQVAGKVTPEAAELTGLLAGTPVVNGVHDCEACALGAGAVRPGEVVIIAGTWNMNMLMVDKPSRGHGMLSLRSAVPGVYHITAMGATSAANLEWFIKACCGEERALAQAQGKSVYDILNALVEGLPPDGLDLIYHPFLHTHGGDLPANARAGFYGISGWHTKSHLLRALYEGVVFAHWAAFGGLRSMQLPMSRSARLTGGAARSPVWSQIFADTLDMEMVVGEAQEVGALGAALCAGVGAGLYTDLVDAVARTDRVARRHQPDAVHTAIYHQRYDVYQHLVEVMKEPWERLATLRKA